MSEVEVEQFASLGEYLRFCVTPDSDPSKEQLKKAIFMLRQLLSIALGVAAGLYQLTGFPVIVVFILLSTGFVHVYSFKYIKIDDSKVENTELYSEALPIAFAVFMMSWIISYTLLI